MNKTYVAPEALAMTIHLDSELCQNPMISPSKQTSDSQEVPTRRFDSYGAIWADEYDEEDESDR